MGTYARIVHHPIRPDAILGEVGDDGDGAVLLFLGTVRNHAEGRPVEGIHYEAYEAMAREVLEEILREVAEHTGVPRLAAVHRIGELEVGEVSIAIAVSSPHRDAGYQASRLVIEEVKRRLPVWKKERYGDGGEEWVGGRAPVEESTVADGDGDARPAHRSGGIAP